MNFRKLVLILVAGAIGLFLLIQLIPFGHTRTNPPVVSEPQWSSPEARALVKEHCFQCHSNETNWTWYANIAPGSWLIAYDVIKGREEFNFSDWTTIAATWMRWLKRSRRATCRPSSIGFFIRVHA